MEYDKDMRIQVYLPEAEKYLFKVKFNIGETNSNGTEITESKAVRKIITYMIAHYDDETLRRITEL